ncbi:MAG TPA: nucleotidyltransferase family protein [Chloroflexota bacterium]
MILAAGKGTRLGALGEQQPKCMLTLGDRPLLQWTVEALCQAGIRDIIVNLHHAPGVIPAHFGDGSGWGIRIEYVYEPEPLGTAGAVRNARHLLGDQDPFLVLYGDTVLDWDPRPLIEAHRAGRPLVTIAVAEESDPSQFGVVQFDAVRRIHAFVEKPTDWRQLGRWVNAGVYALEPTIFDYLPATSFSDFGKDVFPRLLEAGHDLRAYPRPGALHAVDTPDQYCSARSSWTA